MDETRGRWIRGQSMVNTHVEKIKETFKPDKRKIVLSLICLILMGYLGLYGTCNLDRMEDEDRPPGESHSEFRNFCDNTALLTAPDQELEFFKIPVVGEFAAAGRVVLVFVSVLVTVFLMFLSYPSLLVSRFFGSAGMVMMTVMIVTAAITYAIVAYLGTCVFLWISQKTGNLMKMIRESPEGK